MQGDQGEEAGAGGPRQEGGCRLTKVSQADQGEQMDLVWLRRLATGRPRWTDRKNWNKPKRYKMPERVKDERIERDKMSEVDKCEGFEIDMNKQDWYNEIVK